jgi:hypothetical protein
MSNQVDPFENPELKQEVEKDSALKRWLVDYVGDKIKPADGLVTLEMIIDVVAEEFPGFLLAVAEENFIRGYNQAMVDIENPPEELKKLKKSKKKK